jgi:EAL domain-containing protein (putative c-di-GMP-specific phosphodiesterase class I)/CHASE2 domain-containing sensor protein
VKTIATTSPTSSPEGAAAGRGAFSAFGALFAGGFIAVAALAAALGITGRLEIIERPLLDARFELDQRDASGAIAVIEIDARSIARTEDWPWSRRMHARAVERLAAAGADLAAFDVDFSARRGDGDRHLVDAVAQSEMPVVVAGFAQVAGTGRTATIETMPFEALRAHTLVASANVIPDPDGAVRRYLGGTTVAGAVRPSLAAMVAGATGARDAIFYIDYGIRLGDIPVHSFVDLVDGRIPPEALAGRRVLIGATAIELGDRYTTPIHGVVPGVMIQALATESLLQGRALWRVDPLLSALAAVLVVIASGLAVGARRLRLATVALSLPTIATVAIVAQSRFGIIVDLAPTLVAWAGSALLTACAHGWQRIVHHREFDAATGLPLRRRMVSDVAGDAEARAVALARIAGYDQLVAAFGAEQASVVIGTLASRLLAASPSHRVYRISSDTLGLALSIADDADIAGWAAGVEAAFAGGIAVDGGIADVCLRFGVARLRPGVDPGRTVDFATAAMRKATEFGQPWCLHTDDETASDRWEAGLGAALRVAIESGHISAYYQPKVRVADGRLVRVEVLARWNDPVRGSIAPDAFIPIAERNGSIRTLTQFMLATAIRQQGDWQRQGFAVDVAVNISTLDLSDPGFVASVAALAAEHDVEPSTITLEITERAIVGSTDQALAAARDLAARGFRLSIDDYGIGQSTLACLQQFPVGELKIDQSFVRRMCDDPASRVLVRSTIELAHALGIEAVAEGVEDAPTLAALAELGCDYAQGYHTGRPMTAEALQASLAGSVDGRAAAA